MNLFGSVLNKFGIFWIGTPFMQMINLCINVNYSRFKLFCSFNSKVFEDFRVERAKQFESGIIDIDAQIDHLHKWSTNPEYTKLVKDRAKKVHAQLEAKEVDTTEKK